MKNIKYKFIPVRYEIGSDGSIWSNDYGRTGKRQQLKTSVDRDGYLYIFLHNEKIVKKMIHRLVAESFLKQPTPNHQVNHKNGIRNDNRLENLEWVTPRENTLHGWRVNGRKQSQKSIEITSKRVKGINNPNAKINYQIAEEIRNLKKSGKKTRELASIYNLSMEHINDIVRGFFWK